MNIRTRFAPSPTGFMHVGNIRTALFAYLIAKQSAGTFVLRFEDTDKKREVAGSREHLLDSLKALGIQHDEGPDIGGPYGPYTQSERLGTYLAWANKLIEQGRAYADPYTPEEVQAFRDEATANKKAFLFRDHRPEQLPAWDGSTPLRFKSDPKSYGWHDEVMGDMTARPENIDDFVLIKRDGYPTYDFAHIVDDAQMQISHVIRGQEFISSMPKYLNLYEALGLTPPKLAHVPHIMQNQGNKKLGKRDGAKDILDYIRDGYLSETMMSFIATLGWNDGTTQEIFNHDELVAKFSLDRVQHSGARFDDKRLDWMNGQIIRQTQFDELYERSKPFWPEVAKNAGIDYVKQVLKLSQDRIKTLSELADYGYCFSEPEVDMSLIDSNKQLKKLERVDLKNLLELSRKKLEAAETWDSETIQQSLNTLLEETEQKPAVLFSLIRIVTTWSAFSPQLNDYLALIGKEKTSNRLDKAIQMLN